MSDALDTAHRFLSSPYGYLAAGSALATAIWKAFERLEIVAPKMKTPVARWLRVKSFETGLITHEAQNWPGSFTQLFDTIFGPEHLSWKCFYRSCIASSMVMFFSFLIAFAREPFDGGLDYGNPLFRNQAFLTAVILSLLLNAVPDYVSLLLSRLALGLMTKATPRVLALAAITAAQLSFAFGMGSVAVFFGKQLYSWTVRHGILDSTYGLHWIARHHAVEIWLYPAFFTSFWLAVYTTSGFLIKLLQRFDSGLSFFNKWFDIDNHPLEAIGLVGGAVVAFLSLSVTVLKLVRG